MINLRQITSVKCRYRKAIINLIYNEKVISRSEIAKKLNISKPAVADHVDQLIIDKIIINPIEGETTKKDGRKPILLHFNQNYQYVGAINLSVNNVFCSLSNLTCQIIDMDFFEIHQNSSGTSIKKMIAIFQQIMKDKNIHINRLGVIVISQPVLVKMNFPKRFIHLILYNFIKP